MSYVNNLTTNDTPEGCEFSSLGSLYVPRKSAQNDHYVLRENKITATAGVVGAMFNSPNTEFSFEIPKQIGRITHMHVELPLTNTHITAATPKVFTVRGYAAADGSTATAAASGDFVVRFPDLKVETADLAFNTTAANIQVAIRALHPDLASLTVAGSIPSAWNVGGTTFTGVASMQDFKMEFVSKGLAAAGPAFLRVATTVSTAWAAGGSLVIGRSPIVFEDVEYQVNNHVFEKYKGEEAFFHLRDQYKEEELAYYAKIMGWDFDLKRSTNFIDGASGTLTLRVPLVGILAEQDEQMTMMPCCLPSFNFKIRIVLRCQTASIFASDSGSTATFANLSVATPQLFIQHKEYEPQYLKMITYRMRNGFDIRHYERKQLQLETNATLTAGVQKTTNMSGIHADFGDMAFVLRPTSKTNDSHWMEPLKLDSIDVRDQNDNHLLGDDQQLTDFDMRNIIIPSRFPESDPRVKRDYNRYLWCPAAQPMNSKYAGSLSGLWRTDGKDRILWTPTAAAASQTELVAYYNNLRVIRFDGRGSFNYQ